MTAVNLEIVMLALLIAANGVLAMSEMALVSARAARLEPLAKAGDGRARIVLGLLEKPGVFLSTVQIGATLIGILIGVFSGGLVAQSLAGILAGWSLIAPYSQTLAVALVVLLTTYLSLVFGELLPKRLALRYSEGIAMAVARPLRRLSALAHPLVRVLDLSTQTLLRLLSVPAENAAEVSEDEVRFLLRQGADTGVFEPLEHDMVGRVFRLADQKMSALLTPRPDIVWLDLADSQEEIREKVVSSGRSRFPVADGDLDHVKGVVLAKDLLVHYAVGRDIDLASMLRPAIFVPETAPALTVIDRMKGAQSKIAMVIDEYGGVAGLVTVDDVMGAIVGEIPEEDDTGEPLAVERSDGSWLIDGMMTVAEFCERFEIDPVAADRSFSTVGGLVMTLLGRVPQEGDKLEWMALEVEVVDMDARRVDKVLVRPAQTPTPDAEKRTGPDSE